MKNLNTLWIIAILGMLSLLLLEACEPVQAQPQSKEEQRLLAIRAIEIQPKDLLPSIDYIGTVRYHDEVKISARVGGTILEKLAEEGDLIQRDQILLKIDSPELRLKLKSAKAELKRLKTQKAHACHIAETDQKLVKRGALSQAKANASQASCDSAYQAMVAAKSKKAEIELNIQYTHLKSTAEGVLLQWIKEPGEMVGPGMPVALIGVGHKEISVQVSGRDLVQGIGQEALVSVEGLPQKVLEAKILKISPMAKGPARNVEVRLNLPETWNQLPSGTALNVHFILKREEGVPAIPQRAILQTQEGPVIFVIKDQKVHKMPVELGISHNGWFKTKPALSTHTWVATSNLSMLTDGAPVMVVPENNR